MKSQVIGEKGVYFFLTTPTPKKKKNQTKCQHKTSWVCMMFCCFWNSLHHPKAKKRSTRGAFIFQRLRLNSIGSPSGKTENVFILCYKHIITLREWWMYCNWIAFMWTKFKHHCDVSGVFPWGVSGISLILACNLAWNGVIHHRGCLL